MLKYQYIRIAFYGILVILLAGYFFLNWNVILSISVLLFIYLGLISYGAYFIQSGFFLHAYCKGEKNKKQLAITFDDGPDTEVTPLVLDLLKSFNAKATFFCIGKNIAGNEEILKSIYHEGHEIGNHSWSHSYFFDFYRDRQVEIEISRTNEFLEKITGQKAKYFRPPFGVTNPVIARVVNKLNMPVIGWSIRSYDTTIKDPEKLFKRVTARLKPGDILLFHDTNKQIIPVLKRILEFAKQENYIFVNIETLLKNKKL